MENGYIHRYDIGYGNLFGLCLCYSKNLVFVYCYCRVSNHYCWQCREFG